MGDDLSGYRAAIDALFARTTGKSKFGLERTAALLASLGDPHRRYPVLHIAGTNGKGSVCATLETMLRAQGHRVAKYTSPHLVDFRERFLVNGTAIDEQYVVEFIARLTPSVERLEATFFEATTAMAFAWFAEQGVDIAVVEAGLGGRLDSTNVVRPLVAAVTSIGIDHVEQLGDTREAIAAEKGGIFKPGAGAVIGEPDPAIADLLREQALAAGASPLRDVWRDRPPRDVVVDAEGTRFTLDDESGPVPIQTALAGAHQASNTAVALEALELAGGRWWPGLAAAASVLPEVRLPGRFHRVGQWIFDVAHNPDGARVLAQTLRRVDFTRPVAAVLCVLGDKDWRAMMRALRDMVDLFVLTNAPTAPESRAWQLEEVAAFALGEGWRTVVEPDFDAALRRGVSEGATTLITGSFHTVGDAMARLQVNPLSS